MLGLMNSPSETIDFYAPKNDRDSSAFLGQQRRKSTVVYMSDGRRVIDGKVEDAKEPQEMWSDLLIKTAAKRVGGNTEKTLESSDRADENAPSGSIIKPKLLEFIKYKPPKPITVVDYLGSTNVVLVYEELQDGIEEKQKGNDGGEEKVEVAAAEEEENEKTEKKNDSDSDSEKPDDTKPKE